MSIEYFVEGKIKTQVKGDYLIFSKENIVYNSSASIEQQGNKAGIQYKGAKKINPNDIPNNLIEVSLNLFFDGTQNNKTNTEAGKNYKKSNHEDDSYTNDYSNVAKGYDALDTAVENQIRIYIEGIGTQDLKSDTVLPGVALGIGDTGVEAKVTKGCILSAKKLAKYTGQHIHLKVNVYGFSRGATAARHFVHIATTPAIRAYTQGGQKIQVSPPYDRGEKEESYLFTDNDGSKDAFLSKYGYFGACLLKSEVLPKKLTINFIGLYDTVASFGINHRGTLFGIDLYGNDTKDLGLDSINKAYFVLQIAADDEFRDNFDLTNIQSAGVKGLEFTLPGVHSDIGGCYVNEMPETVDLYKEYGSKKQCERYRSILIEEGWYQPEELNIRYIPPVAHEANESYILVGHRKNVFNTYDKVSLNTMLYYSAQFNVKYKKSRIEKDHQIKDEFLRRIYNNLLDYMSACGTLRNDYVAAYNKTGSSGDYIEKIKKICYEDFFTNLNDLKTLRNKYLHWSSSVTKFGLGPKTGKVSNGKERKRNIQNG